MSMNDAPVIAIENTLLKQQIVLGSLCYLSNSN